MTGFSCQKLQLHFMAENEKNRGYTKEDEIKQEINHTFEVCRQLLTIRWQAVGIAITLISAYWIFALPEIVDKKQEPGVMYLLLFLGVFFSIIILLVWRFINHAIKDEETGYWDTVFTCQTLLKNYSGLCEKQLEEKRVYIRNCDLKIYRLTQCLSNEFDDKIAEKIVKKFNKLSPEKQYELTKKNLYHKRFEKGQLKFDWLTFGLIIVFWVIGCLLLYQIYFLDANNALFKLFKTNFYNFSFISKFISLYGLTSIIFTVGLFYFIYKYYWKEYLTPNFLRSN
jgi:hypothetical protein